MRPVDDNLKELLATLVSLAPDPIYLVGGPVRDLLIGIRDIKDIDLVMATGSEKVSRKFADRINGSFFFLDEARCMTRVVVHSQGGHLQFDFANFEGADLHADLKRRDFTMNAMALDLRRFLAQRNVDGLVDPFSGAKDIKQHLIRVTLPQVLDEDPLRLLRAPRFAATLRFVIEQTTAAEIRARASRIIEPSAERVRDELFLLLAERDADKHLLLLDSLGLLGPLFPELETLRNFAPGRYHVHDVLMHSIKTVGYCDRVIDDLEKISPEHGDAVATHLDELLEQHIPRKAALRFACLLHDNAKPDTLDQSNGRIRFHNHDLLGADKAARVCRRFKLSRDTEKAVTGLIRQHMRLFNLATPGGPSKNALHRYCREMGDALPESLVLAQADARATAEIMPAEKFTDTEKPMATALAYYYEKFLKVEAEPFVTGEDLIRIGMEPGPAFRTILEDVRERQAAGLLIDRQAALDYIAQKR